MEMSKALLVVLLLPVILTEAIIGPEDEVTKPPKHRENLQWPPDHPNYVPPRAKTVVHDQPSEKYRDVVLVHTVQGSRAADGELCPDKATGQFTYLPDCRKFINCWKGRGFIQACAPGTLFNPKSLECDFPAKVKCLPYEEEGKSEAIKQETKEVETTEELDYVGKGIIDVRFGTEFESPPNSSSRVHRTSTVSKRLPVSSLEYPHSSIIPVGQQSSRHYPSSSSYPNSNAHNPLYPPSSSQPSSSINPVSFPSKTPPTGQKIPSGQHGQFYPSSPTAVYPPRQEGHPSSPSPWVQPPHPSNAPPQNQGRFPPRQPHSLNTNTHGSGYNPAPSPPSGYNPSHSPPQYPGSQQHYPQSHGQQHYPRPYSPFLEHSHQYPGNYNQQQPGYNPQYSGSHAQFPGSYPQSSSNQHQYHGNRPQYSGGSRYPGNQQQYPGSYPQSHHNQPQYPGTNSQSSGNQQYPENHPEASRNQSSAAGRQVYPANTRTSTEAPQGRDLSPKYKPECSMPGGTGLAPHPTDCRKFLDCWKGSPHTQFCAPGTLFNPSLLQCDHPYNVDCKKSTDSQDPGKKWVPPKDSTHSTTPRSYSGSTGNPPGYGSNPSSLSGHGSNPSNPPGYGSNPSNPPGYGSNPSSPSGYGSNPFNPPGYGSNPSNPPGYGSNPSNPSGFSSNPSNPSEFGSNPSNPPGYGSNTSNPPGYGSNPSNPTGFGSNPSKPPGYGSNPSGFGSNPSNPSGFGSNPSNSPGFGSNSYNPSGYGSNPSNPSGYGSNPSNPSGYGSNPYDPSRYGSNPLNPSGYGSNPYSPSGYGPGPHSPVGFGSVDRPDPSGSNIPTHSTSKPPSANVPTSADFPPDGSSHSQTTRSTKNTTPQPFIRTSTRQTLTTLTADASDIQPYYVPGSGPWKPEASSVWVPESQSVDHKVSTVQAAAAAPRPTTYPQPPHRVASTTKKPTYIMSIPAQSKPAWKPPSSTTRPKIGYTPSLMTSGQVIRLRGGQGPFEGYVEVQGSTPGWGVVCDEINSWNIDEASVVCKQLGYNRGAELSWQGRPVRPTDDTIHVSVSEVTCFGNEEDFLSCRMVRGAGQCLIPRDAVGVRCYRNHMSVCQEGEVNHGGKCYSVIVPKEDTALEAFSHGEALADCQKRKGKLLDITSQAESDFMSELLLQSYPHINSIITSGIGVRVMGHPLWIWEGSGETFKFQKWWPGWTGNETAPTANTSGDRMNCVVAKRVFPCQAPYLPDTVGLANLCEANYFYWATEDCSVTHDHPYVCERPHDDVGCVNNSGQDYMGPANISSTGSPCIPWDSPLTPAALKYRMAYKVRQRTMVGHNYCRNVAGGETHPWCYVGPEAQFQYCDIPECQSTIGDNVVDKTSNCTMKEFECKPGQCIPTIWVCDGQADCVNGNDELNCPAVDESTVSPTRNTNTCGFQEFECSPGECIISSWVCNRKSDCLNGKDEENCPDTIACASNEFQCRAREVIGALLVCDGKTDCSNGRDEQNCPGVKKTNKGGAKSSTGEFLCHPNECILASRVCDGVQDCIDGKDEKECRVGDNVVDKTSNCTMKEFECKPGQCIPTIWVCDGQADCDNENDELNCPDVEKAVRGALKCGPKEFECRPGECVLSTWVCDGAKDCSNGRDEKDCSGSLGQFSKHLNRRLMKHDKQKWLESDAGMCADHCINAKGFTCRSFSHLPKDRICVLSDSNVGLSGDLNHTAEWQYYERRSTSLQCDNLFQCDNGKCVNKSMVCDGKNNCGDRTDERNCSAEYLDYEIRLAGGNSSNEGRVEVKVFGQWGSICDDLFGLRDAEVVCRELNFTMGAAEVVGQSMFGGISPKFLVDDLQCRGNETSIRECDFDGWGVHDCGPEEAVGVVCRVPGVDCKVSYWRCDKSSECIPVGFLCDNVPDCEDGSDESAAHCEAPVELRLVGGASNMSGRVEVRYNGVWGTVCDDDFTDTAAQVICHMLGFGGPAEAKKDAAFGLGEGQIWLDQVHCTGKELHIEDCLHSQWGENNCAHEEDASVVCSVGQVPKPRTERNKPKVVATLVMSPDVTVNQILPAHCGLKSDDYWEMAARTEDRVLGGNEVAQGSFPWQASLRVRTAGKSVHWCGAVVISPLHILTAGHCLQDYTKGAYLIRVGDHDTEANDTTEQEASIDEIYLHEGFNKGPRLNNDIALVKMKAGGFRLGPSVQPICLPPSNVRYHSGLNCSISGWGTIKAGGTGYARKLRAAWISVIPDDVCRAEYVYGSKAITEGMVCAGDLEGRADSCQGDSGGPLICLNNGRFTLFGITSWGHGCGRPNKPGVYSHIGYFRSWIDQKLKASMTGK